jgi:hypothetical protein
MGSWNIGLGITGAKGDTGYTGTGGCKRILEQDGAAGRDGSNGSTGTAGATGATAHEIWISGRKYR